MFVLIHGGGHSARCWEPTVPLLNAPALAIDLPGRGTRPAPLDTVRLSDWIDSAVDDITNAGVTDAVLVGHSMAGLSIPSILDRAHDRFRHLAFVSCVVPPEGKSLVTLLPDDLVELVNSAQPTPDGVSVPEEGVIAQQCYDMDDAQTKFTLDIVVPEAFWPVREPVSLAGLRHPVPRTWVRLTGDVMFPPSLQNEFASRTGCTDIIDVESGHMAMISHPHQLAAVLNRIHG
jgi:pimeloyl-ACP methyl ester carboxylesterase